MLDASLRTIKVMGIHAEGGDWMRESARQLTGFGLGGAFGLATGRLTFFTGVWGASQAGLIVAGPLGWAVLGGIFAMSLSAGYVAGSKADNLGQRGSSFIMNLKS